jgi:enoyl-CoA hydratase
MQVGLVNEVYDDHAAMVEAVLSTAAEIATKSPLAIHGSKQMLLHARDNPVASALEHVATWQMGALQPADMMEAFQAKAEKRTPAFDDLPPVPRGL